MRPKRPKRGELGLDGSRSNQRTNAELGLVSVLQVNLSEIQPSPLNAKLYRPVTPSDPDVIALAKSIKVHGVKEPLVLSTDKIIISGHRRHMAAGLAGLETVPCRIEPIHSGDPRFLVLLRECNRQRVKAFDEIVREEVVLANPEEAHRALLAHRRRRACVDVDAIEIQGRKHRCKITAAKEPFLKAILDVLERYKDLGSLSVRQIHYYLLNDPPLIHAAKPESRYVNTQKCYKAADELITRARLAGRIPFERIHDPTRPVVTWHVFPSPTPFIRRELEDFLQGYYRDYQQSQPNHIEIVGEKNTVEGIIRPVAMDYCIPYTLGRGYCSVPPRYDMFRRFRASGKESLIILALSDFDPEGEDIAHAFARSMRDDLGIANIVPVKVALTLDQVNELGLPPQMQAKQSSSRYAGFVEKYGEDVYELEAVPPDVLQRVLREAIDSVLDLKAFNAEIDAEKGDAAHLDRVRRSVLAMLKDLDSNGQP